MSLRLTKSTQYIVDLKRFTENVHRITNPKLKTEVERLMKEFKHQASLIDNEHETLSRGYPDPSKTKEYVTKLAKVRKRLYQIFNDLDK